MKYVWRESNGADFLMNIHTGRNAVWISQYPDLGYRIALWNDHTQDWEGIGVAPDLDSAKAIAKLNVEGELV